MDFVAIDFETANEHRASVCAVGVVRVSDGQIADRKSWLVRPKRLDFNYYNVAVHGITAEQVKDAPTFCDVWSELRSFLDGNMVVAHNASFDMSVLRYAVADDCLEHAEFPFSCTRLIGKRAWPGLISYSLPIVAHQLGIQFQHHDALEDARAAAEVAIKACLEAGVRSLEELAECLRLRIGWLSHDSYLPAAAPSPGRSAGSSRIEISELQPRENAKPHEPLVGKLFVFTGTLRTMSRVEAMQAVIDGGGQCGNGITKATNYLVMGDQDFVRLRGADKSSKLRKAEAYIEKGADLELLAEEEFLQMLPGLSTEGV